MKNNKLQPSTQHQKEHQHHQQNEQQQQQTQLKQGLKKQGQSPKVLQHDLKYQEHEHPEARLTR